MGSCKFLEFVGLFHVLKYIFHSPGSSVKFRASVTVSDKFLLLLPSLQPTRQRLSLSILISVMQLQTRVGQHSEHMETRSLQCPLLSPHPRKHLPGQWSCRPVNCRRSAIVTPMPLLSSVISHLALFRCEMYV